MMQEDDGLMMLGVYTDVGYNFASFAFARLLFVNIHILHRFLCFSTFSILPPSVL